MAGATTSLAAAPPGDPAPTPSTQEAATEEAPIDDVPEAEAMHAELSARFLDADYDGALQIAQDLLHRRREAFGPGHATVTASLSDIATIRGRTGDLPGAIEAYTEALALRVAALGPAHPDVGALHTLRSTAYYKLGRMDEAEADLLKAEQIVPVTDRRYAFILQNLGGIALVRGHGDQATRLLEESFHLRVEHDGPDHPGALRVAAVWATAAMDNRPLVEGCAASRDILQWTLERYGQGHPETATAWQLSADCRRNSADLEGAEYALRQALDAAAKDRAEVTSTIQGDFALLEILQGDARSAIARCEAALKVLTGQEMPARFGTLQGIYGRALLADGRAEEAYAQLKESAAFLLEAVGPEAEATLTSQRYLGRAAMATQRPEGAEILMATLERQRHREGVAKADAAWADVGMIAIQSGDVEGGLQTMLEGEQASIAYYGASNPATLLARVPRIEALIAVGRAAEARQPLIESVALYTAWQAQAQSGKNSRQALALSALGRRLQDLVLLVLDSPEDSARAWSIVLALKGGARRSTDLVASQAADSEESQRDWTQLSRLRRERAKAVLSGEDDSDIRAARDRLEEAIAERAAQPLPAPPEPAQLQAALPRKAGLIDLVVVGGDHPRLVAFVVTRQRVTRVDLGEIAVVERTVQRLISTLQANSFESEVVDQVRAEAGRILIAPLAGLMRPMRQVWIVPDGPIARLPFAALPDVNGKYVIERRTLRVLEDARDVLRPPVGEPGDSAVVIGDVDYGSGTSAACAPGPFSRLPGTAHEAQMVAEALGTTPITGTAPTFEAVRAALPSAGVVHLASHGFYADRCETDDSIDALALSGVALAGANEGADGVLTASDVLDLDLGHTELVVLSACQTGAGQVQVGEGVLGLRWALHRAGAGSLLLAMYRVPDAPTVALMERFYHHWKPGFDPAIALQRAQRDRLRAQRKTGKNQPGEWAGFVVSGAPRP